MEFRHCQGLVDSPRDASRFDDFDLPTACHELRDTFLFKDERLFGNLSKNWEVSSFAHYTKAILHKSMDAKSIYITTNTNTHTYSKLMHEVLFAMQFYLMLCTCTEMTMVSQKSLT